MINCLYWLNQSEMLRSYSADTIVFHQCEVSNVHNLKGNTIVSQTFVKKWISLNIYVKSENCAVMIFKHKSKYINSISLRKKKTLFFDS
mgnify:CR=1 FL=1